MPRFIDLYYEWMEKGELPNDGLCLSVPDELDKVFYLFLPTYSELTWLFAEGFDITFWASEKLTRATYQECAKFFNPLRQNIILLCAAINDEL